MMQSQTRYEIMECEDEEGFNPSGESERTLEKAEAELERLLARAPELYRKAFICEVVTTRVTARKPEVHHELQTIPTAG